MTRRGRRPWHVQTLLVREPGDLKVDRSVAGEVSQSWLVRFVEHRIGDPRLIRLIQKWLKAGVLEDGIVTTSDKGTGRMPLACLRHDAR